MGSYRIAPGGDVKCRKENTVNNVAINIHSVSGGTGLRAVGGGVRGGGRAGWRESLRKSHSSLATGKKSLNWKVDRV